MARKFDVQKKSLGTNNPSFKDSICYRFVISLLKFFLYIVSATIFSIIFRNSVISIILAALISTIWPNFLYQIINNFYLKLNNFQTKYINYPKGLTFTIFHFWLYWITFIFLNVFISKLEMKIGEVYSKRT